MQTISKLLCYIIAVLKRAAIILIKRGLIYEEQKNFGNRLVRSNLFKHCRGTYASALASDTPKVSTSETGNTSGADILYQDTDGGQISVDGKNWVAEADYEKNNAAPDVQWWTADEYEAWMNEQKKEMESLIGTGDGWYDGEGVFHEFTQESVAAMMDSYKGTLESIKKGVLYSKDNGDGDTYSMIPPTEDVVSSYSVDVTKDNGKTVHIGDYSTVEELDKAISDAVKNGQLTQEEADAVNQ